MPPKSSSLSQEVSFNNLSLPRSFVSQARLFKLGESSVT